MSRVWTLRKLLGLPFWALQLFTGAKSFVDNPIIGSRRFNQWGLHSLRVRLAHKMAAQRRARLASRVSPDHRAQFNRDGFVRIDNFMPQNTFEQLRAALLEGCFRAREMVQGDTITRRIAIDGAMLERIPALASLLRNPVWAGLMRYVASFDIEPLYYIQTIIREAGDAPPDPQIALHSDTFQPSMKAWFFLDDVDQGPFTFVPGSHRATAARLAWEKARSIALSDGGDRLSTRGSLRVGADELQAMGLPPAMAFQAQANTLVVADTYGFHARGPSDGSYMRVEIWAYARRSPFLPWTGFDLLSVPRVAENRVNLLWRFRDRFSALVGQPWQDVGVKAPLDR